MGTLRRIIQAIHSRKPEVIIVVMGTYPEAKGQETDSTAIGIVAEVNQAVRNGLKNETNVYFADYTFPSKTDVYQTLHCNHPNCRGDKVIATAAVETLFREKILATGLDLADAAECLAAEECDALSASCCLRSAFCRLAPNNSCIRLGPGKQ